MMLGGLGRDGVVIGGRGRDTDTAMGLGASVTGAGSVVAGLPSVLTAVGVVAPDAIAEAADVAGAAGLAATDVVETETAGVDLAAVVETGAEAAVGADVVGANAVVDVVGVDADAAGALIGSMGRTELATGVAGSVGVGMAAGVEAARGLAAI